MYSVTLERLLKEKGISIGDRISIKVRDRKFEGILMPQPDSGDPDKLVIKMDSGYNVGLSADNLERVATARRVAEPAPKLRFDPAKPAISIISTGGTIASKVDYETGGVKTVEKPEELLLATPELAHVANVRSVSRPFAKMSEDMSHTDWIDIAREVANKLNSGDRGVIVAHGTDFLHFTSAALSFFLRNLGKPVVLVGSQRSIDRGSSDAAMNLVCGAITAAANIAEVGICMHGSTSDDYCSFIRGTKVRKMHTSRRDAFKPINEAPLAKVWPNGEMERTNADCKVRDDSKQVELDAAFEPKVALVKAYPGSDPSVLDHLAYKGCKGFIIEASGLGHVPTNGRLSWIPTIRKLVKDGVFIGCAPQTIFGRINPDVYSNLRVLYREAGAVPLEDMLAETAYVKLGWVLAHSKDMDEIRKMMLTSYAGEITPRSRDEGYLD